MSRLGAGGRDAGRRSVLRIGGSMDGERARVSAGGTFGKGAAGVGSDLCSANSAFRVGRTRSMGTSTARSSAATTCSNPPGRSGLVDADAEAEAPSGRRDGLEEPRFRCSRSRSRSRRRCCPMTSRGDRTSTTSCTGLRVTLLAELHAVRVGLGTRGLRLSVTAGVGGRYLDGPAVAVSMASALACASWPRSLADVVPLGGMNGADDGGR